MSDWLRERALLRVWSDLGPHVLSAVSMSAREAISEPYEIQLTLLSNRPNIDPDEVLYHGMTVALQHDGEPQRFFHGIVQSLAWDGHAGGRGLTRYNARLVPHLWFLGQTGDCRVFQKRSMADIIRAIMGEHELPPPDFRLRKTHGAREYVTQYNETDLQFVARLLQEEGCFYFFEHSQDNHSLVIADDNSAFRPLGCGPLRFDASAEADEVLTAWRQPKATAQGRVRLTDYDPAAPRKQLDQTHRTILKTGGASARDTFHWPALSHDTSEINDRARYRLEAEEAAVSLAHGQGRHRMFTPGYAFTLAENPQTGGRDEAFVLSAVRHAAVDDTMLSGGGGTSYTASFTAFPSSVPWRMPFSVPRPRMDGVQAALVIGPEGTPIHADPLGRVKVMFFWDHRREADPNMAIWARVIYPWGGDGWGWQSTPRVGTEVAVAFLDGDPDRPVIVGSLYNGHDSTIFSESDKTKTGIRTRSVPRGTSSNFSELSFDDAAGQEVLYIQAEKDMKTLVKNDQELTVNHCRIVHVKQDETITIDNKQSIEIGGGRATLIKSGDDSLELGQGNVSIAADAGAVDVNAMQSITLTVGETSVKIDQAGVTINGMLLDFSAVASLKMHGATVQASADAAMMMSAGLITLN